MKYQEFQLSIQNLPLHVCHWHQSVVSHLIILVHGMGEHAGRYADFVVPSLVKNGAAVIDFDQVGHGKSGGKRGHCSSYEVLLESLHLVIQKGKELYKEKPVFVYGQSMGGNVSLNYTLRKTPELSGVIASSPFLRLAFQPPAWKMTLGKLLLKILPAVTLPMDLDTNALSKDPKEVKKYEQDPLVHNKISPNFSFPIIEAGEWAIQNSQKLLVPALVMHGTADRIIDHKGSIAFAKNNDLVSLKLFEGGFHELHNDLEKEEVLLFVTDWVNHQLKK
ncbi:alpha/beta hydrolase [Ascidiimonas sp. W6]|uniref:alpha/beta hydrolase n=1 Tax=Ascidiimonas meishanensis TaxID=3128903 RepID=UPI0030EB211E